MTVICGGAASRPIAGFAPNVQVSTAMLGAAAINWPARWAVAYAGFLAAVNYNLTTMCATDPPADPGFTAADGLAMLNPWSMDPIPFSNASAKLQQLLQRYLWYQFCECATMATPAVPAAPAAPANLPDPAPPLSGPLPSGCQFVPAWAGTIGSGFASNGATFQAGLNPTSFQGTCYWSSFGAGPHPQQTYTVSFSVPGLAGAQGVRTFTPTINVPLTVVVPVPAGANAITLSVSCTAGGTDTTQFGQTWLFCNGQIPGVPAAPCCPPDPTMMGMLENVLGYVKLLQRQLAPFSYVTGTAHAGITGTGTFAVQGLLGMKVAVTAYPATNRVSGGEPSYIYDLGWMSIETPDGFIDEVRVRSTAQVWQPRMMSDATRFGYYLRPGVTATFTELVRES